MKLTKISARNFKGLTFSLELTDMNLLVGSNFAGKSARTDAIRLCLIGYLPELGKTARATFGLASGKEMEVTGEFDDGTVIRRNWYLRGDTVSSTSLLPPWYKDDSLLTVMLNTETYFALSERERINYVASNVSSPSQESPEAIELKLAKCKEDESSARAHAVRMEKSIQGLAGLRTMDAQCQSLTHLDAKKATLEAELRELYAEKQKHMAAFDASRANRQRRKDLQEALRGRLTVVARRDAATNTLDARMHELSQIEDVSAEDFSKTRMEDKDASLALGKISEQLRQVEESIARNELELASIEEKLACPYCGAAGDGWKALKTGEIKSALAGLRVKQEQLIDHRSTMRTYAESVARRMAEMQDAVNARHAIMAKVAGLVADLSDTAELSARMEERAKELAQLPPEDPNVQATTETLQSSINVKAEELRAVEIARTAAIARESELRRLAQFETERDAAKVDQQVAATAAETLRGIQRKMVEDAFGPLLETANRIFGSVLRSPLAYNADNAEIGTWRDGVWVGHKTFSGTEKALCYASIQAALAARSPVKLMIIDELGRLDTKNAAAIVNCAEDAVRAELIEQYIGIDTGRSELYKTLVHERADLTVTEIS